MHACFFRIYFSENPFLGKIMIQSNKLYPEYLFIFCHLNNNFIFWCLGTDTIASKLFGKGKLIAFINIFLDHLKKTILTGSFC